MPKTVYIPERAVTDMQERFALGIAGGLTPTEAARVAGFSAPGVAGARLKDHPGVRAVIRAHRERRIDRLASLSLRVLEDLVRGRARGLPISPAVQFNAVKLTLALAGHRENGKTDEDDANPLNRKRVSEMSLDELDAFLAKERERRAGAAKPILDHQSDQSGAKSLKDNEKAQPLAGCGPTLEGVATVAEPAEGGAVPADAAIERSDRASDPPPGGYPP